MSDLTQEQADRLARWRWGSYGEARQRIGVCMVLTSFDSDSQVHYGDTFTAAFRASMQSPMSDKDAELEAKLRWGDVGHARRINGHCFVGIDGAPRDAEEGGGLTWEQAYENANHRAGVRAEMDNQKAPPCLSATPRCPSGNASCMLCGHGVAGRRTREYTGRLTFIGACNFGAERCYGFADGTMFEVSEWDLEDARGSKCTRVDRPKVGDDVRMVLAAERAYDRARVVYLEVVDASVADPDLTQPEALAEAKALWGERAYAFDGCTVGCAGITRGMGTTFREAFDRAQWNRVCLALATAFGAVGCAAVRERNKAIGQIMEPPEWAYPLAWRNAVMAAVEWCNARPTPELLLAQGTTLGAIEALVHLYHRHRMNGQTASSARAGYCREGEMWWALLDRYERGRPGGGR